MTSLTFSSPELWHYFEFLPWRKIASRRDRTDQIDSRDDSRARREFIHDMLTKNPDAFASDLDVHTMMQMYPGQF